jgi:hypothetical protein
VIAIVAIPLAARQGQSVTELRGESAIRATIEMPRPGFQCHSGGDDDYNTTNHSWHRDDKDCVLVQILRSRVVAIRNRRASDGGERDGGNGAAIAAGSKGLAALGALQLSIKDKDTHASSTNRIGRTCRPATPGRANCTSCASPIAARVIDKVGEGASLPNYGSARRSGKIWYRVSKTDGRSPGWAHDLYMRPIGGQVSGWNGSGGSAGGCPIQFADLAGVRGASAQDAMRDRGLRNLDGFKQGSTNCTICYREISRQCVQAAVANGRVDKAVDIQTHPACR